MDWRDRLKLAILISIGQGIGAVASVMGGTLMGYTIRSELIPVPLWEERTLLLGMVLSCCIGGPLILVRLAGRRDPLGWLVLVACGSMVAGIALFTVLAHAFPSDEESWYLWRTAYLTL